MRLSPEDIADVKELLETHHKRRESCMPGAGLELPPSPSGPIHHVRASPARGPFSVYERSPHAVPSGAIRKRL
jgi:hypothetical protein